MVTVPAPDLKSQQPQRQVNTVPFFFIIMDVQFLPNVKVIIIIIIIIITMTMLMMMMMMMMMMIIIIINRGRVP